MRHSHFKGALQSHGTLSASDNNSTEWNPFTLCWLAAYEIDVIQLTVGRHSSVVAIHRLPVWNRKLTGSQIVRNASAQLPSGRHDPMTAHIDRRRRPVFITSGTSFTGSNIRRLSVWFFVSDRLVRKCSRVEVTWLCAGRRSSDSSSGGVSSCSKGVLDHRAAGHVGKPEVGVNRSGRAGRAQSVPAMTPDK